MVILIQYIRPKLLGRNYNFAVAPVGPVLVLDKWPIGLLNTQSDLSQLQLAPTDYSIGLDSRAETESDILAMWSKSGRRRRWTVDGVQSYEAGQTWIAICEYTLHAT